jgi:hypothetical protein
MKHNSSLERTTWLSMTPRLIRNLHIGEILGWLGRYCMLLKPEGASSYRIDYMASFWAVDDSSQQIGSKGFVP